MTPIAIGLIAGMIIAFLISLLSRRSNTTEAAELDEVRNDFDQYKQQVNGHFARTAELVGRMTADYRAVYEHLADSADQLCGPDASGQPLDFPHVTLLEQRRRDEALAETADDAPVAEQAAAEAPEAEPTEAEDKPEAGAAEAPVAASIPDSIDPKKPA